MIQTVFDTAALPAADRFDHWSERIGRTHAPMELSSEYANGFRGRQRLVRLGSVYVWPAVFQPMVFRRTPRLVRSSDPEVYHLSLLLRGAAWASWRKTNIAYAPRDFHINDSALVNEIWAGGSALVSSVGVEIPKPLLPFPRHRAERLVGRKVQAHDGPAALLADFLTRLVADVDSYRPADGPRLGAVLVDLAAALFAHVLDADDDLEPETRRGALLHHVRSFVQRNLHDPDLGPQRIADVHHISVSYLHRLFRGEDTTVTAWIRRERLRRARRDLADPALAEVPIHRIAMYCGFTNAATFSRAFRADCGLSPSEYRQQISWEVRR